MSAAPNPKRFTVGGTRKRFTREEALAKAAEVFAKTGVVASVEEKA